MFLPNIMLSDMLNKVVTVPKEKSDRGIPNPNSGNKN